MGRIRVDKKNHAVLHIWQPENMLSVIHLINGEIRLKVDSFRHACTLLNVDFIEADYNICRNSSYFAGLIDTDGSIIYNYLSNRIECALELKANCYSSRLNFNNLFPGNSTYCLLRNKTR